jgi:hypothetical protein
MPEIWQSICGILDPTEIFLVVAKYCLMSRNNEAFAAMVNCSATETLSIVRFTCAALDVGLANTALVTIPSVALANV